MGANCGASRLASQGRLHLLRHKRIGRAGAQPVPSRFGGKSSVRQGHSRRGQVVRPKLDGRYVGNCDFDRKESTDHFNESAGRIVGCVTCLTFKSVKVCNCAARPELSLSGEEIHQSAFMDIKARALLLARLAIAGSIFGIVLAVVVAWQGLWLSCAIASGAAIASADFQPGVCRCA
jgi:hypothetical protein